MNPARALRIIWVLAGLAIALGLARDTVMGWLPEPRELPRLDGRSGLPWVSADFVLTAKLPEDVRGLLPDRVQTASSWVGQDDWQGRAETAWFRAARSTINVGVAGHPGHPDCALWVEFKDAAGSVRRVDCRIRDPGGEWGVWEVARPRHAVAVRVIAEDRARGSGGWVAFSHPFRAAPAWIQAAYQCLQILTTVALALVVVWLPGLSGVRRCPRHLRPAVLIGIGPLLLAASGTLIWSLTPWVPARVTGTLIVTAIWALCGWELPRAAAAVVSDNWLRAALVVAGLLVIAAVAKSSYSVGPQGELFRGAVSRNLALSDRIDSRFSYYTVQVAAHGYLPASAETEAFFYPWTFFSRGPLSGLTALPVVMATQSSPRASMPDQRWSPFDRTGFTSYRITMITLASVIVVAIALGFRAILGARGALIAAGLVALSPFGFHEVMFTWPKWPATAWLVVAFGLAHGRRPSLAGLAIGIGFLFHPLTLLWSPFVGVWAGLRVARKATRSRTGPFILGGLLCAGSACVLALPWMALGAWMPHLPTTPFAGQGGFLKYWVLADWHHATWETWWRTRWMNFANTFIPLHLVFDPTSFNHPKLGSAYEPSRFLVRFAQVWWNSFPFGLGLGLWGMSGVALWQGRRHAWPALLLFLVVPAFYLVAYWGMDPLGLMRECGHPLLVAIVVLACWLGRRGGTIASRLAHGLTPWLQLPETFLMLWLTTLLNPQPWPVEHPHLDLFYLGLNALALVLAARVLSSVRVVDAPLSSSCLKLSSSRALPA